MRRIALPEYQATPGNRAAWCRCRTEGDVTHFEMLTFWEDVDSIKSFRRGRLHHGQVLRFRLRLPDRKGARRSPLRAAFADLARPIAHRVVRRPIQFGCCAG